jgi:hypothetical protein
MMTRAWPNQAGSVNLARRHVTFSRRSPRQPGPDLKPVAEVVADRVWRGYLDRHAPQTRARFEEAIETARSEEE